MLRFSSKFFLILAFISIPASILFFYLVSKSRKKALDLFGDSDLVEFLSRSVDRNKRRWKYILFSLSIIFLFFALARPQLGTRLEEVKREGIDLIIALDVSNSMYAEDVKPSRLSKAKHEIRKLIEMLQGDRVALVVFAGDAFIQCPLTLDYSAFEMLLDEVDPYSVPVQGTAIAKAIEVGTEAFVQGERKHKVMLLITDGEDHAGDPEKAARKAKQEGVVIYTVGIGSPTGVPIPQYDRNGNKIGIMKDENGGIVTTRLDEETLQRVALETEGKYYPARPGQAELEAIIKAISGMETKEFQAKKFAHYEDRFQYPLALSMILMIIAFIIPERKRVSGTLSDFVKGKK
ncbi:MAG: vWA domain-containing protein [Candidatus Zixiibacteriota bacterium]